MTTFISMLRGINVGGAKRLSMDSLRQIYAQLGFTRPRTYVQSGNVVFESAEKDRQVLVVSIEGQIEQACGFHTQVFIRTADEIKRILAGNPFLTSRNEDQSRLHVTFYYQAPAETSLAKLTVPTGIKDEFAMSEMAVYLFCPDGYGKTKLSNTFFEKKLGIAVTTRNWNTVNALYKMAVEV